jgi:hypothetical protein
LYDTEEAVEHYQKVWERLLARRGNNLSVIADGFVGFGWNLERKRYSFLLPWIVGGGSLGSRSDFGGAFRGGLDIGNVVAFWFLKSCLL